MRRIVVVACSALVGLGALAGCGAAAPFGSAPEGSAPVGSTSPGTSSAASASAWPASAGSRATTTVPTTSEVQMPAKLSPHGSEVLARARRSGVPNVVLVISTEAASTERTASALRGLGATVEATDTSIGYIRVSVPIADVERVVAAEGVRQVDVDEPLSNGDPTP